MNSWVLLASMLSALWGDTPTPRVDSLTSVPTRLQAHEGHVPGIFDQFSYNWAKVQCEEFVDSAQADFQEKRAQWPAMKALIEHEWFEHRQCLRRLRAVTDDVVVEALKSTDKRVCTETALVLGLLLREDVCPTPSEPAKKPSQWDPPICVSDLQYHSARWYKWPCDWSCWGRKQWSRLEYYFGHHYYNNVHRVRLTWAALNHVAAY